MIRKNLRTELTVFFVALEADFFAGASLFVSSFRAFDGGSLLSFTGVPVAALFCLVDRRTGSSATSLVDFLLTMLK